jgi:hypothetical protein
MTDQTLPDIQARIEADPNARFAVSLHRLAYACRPARRRRRGGRGDQRPGNALLQPGLRSCGRRVP